MQVQVKACKTMGDYMQRVANAIDVGASVEDIHDMLIREGLSEYGAYITYMAGKLLSKSRGEK
jgi:hypothetical protein